MVRSDVRLLRALTLGLAAALTLAACGGTVTSKSGAPSSGASGAPQAGGTIYVLTQSEQIDQIDPQRMYTGEDLALFGGTIYRSLEAYKFSADPAEGTSLTPDLATDLGTPNATGDSWQFTLRDGVTFQDGSPITCEDVKYGTSRTFATDVINQGPTYAVAYLDIPTISAPGTPEDGSSAYKGPYTDVGQDLFDKAVTCDGNTITFNLNKPVADFNYTVTLGFSPVPEAADTGETYGTVAPFAVSSGPVQDRELHDRQRRQDDHGPQRRTWDPASDPYRKAYPDKWESRLRDRPEGPRPAAHRERRQRQRPPSSTVRSSRRTSA